MTIQEQKKVIDRIRRDKLHEKARNDIDAVMLEDDIAALKEVSDTLDEMDRMLAALDYLRGKR